MDEEGKGSALVALLEELDGMVGDEICHVTFLGNILDSGLRRTETRTIVLALILKNVVLVEAFRLASHVPFAHDSSLVACGLEHLAHEGDGAVDAFVQPPLPILVTIQAGHQTGATRRA